VQVSPRARVLPASEARHAEPLFPTQIGKARRRVAREEVEARLTAERILQEAHERAAAIAAGAREQAAARAEEAARLAREEAEAQLAARWLALREREQASIERDRDRVVISAVALAERILGAALELSPERIEDLARTVIDEARGVRKAIVEANPLDADELRRVLTGNGLGLQSVEVRGDAGLARGELRLHTDVGTIDARLAPRFERLAAALRDALR
jgi:flagellar assembly protein FliH